MRLLGGSLAKPSKVDGGGVPLEGALAVSAARAAARHRTVAGQPAGYPTRKNIEVSTMHVQIGKKMKKS